MGYHRISTSAYVHLCVVAVEPFSHVSLSLSILGFDLLLPKQVEEPQVPSEVRTLIYIYGRYLNQLTSKLENANPLPTISYQWENCSLVLSAPK